MRVRLEWIACLLLGVFSSGLGQEKVEAPVIPESAQPYYERLIEQPRPGVLIDRLCSSWRETETLEVIAAALEEQAKDTSGNDADARAVIAALVYSKIGKLEKAIRWFEIAIERNPAERTVFLWKARTEVARRNWRGALEALDRLLADKGSVDDEPALAGDLELEGFKLRGRLLIRMARSGEAIDAFESALKESPDDLDLLTDLIELLWEEGQGDVAVEKLQALIEKTDQIDAYSAVQNRLWLSELYRTRNETDQALKILDSALKMTGRDTWIETSVLDRLERIYEEADDPGGLEKHLEDLKTGGENRLAIGRLLARLSANQGEWSAARERYRAILKRTPGRRDVREEFIEFLEKQELWEEAVGECQRLYQQDTTDLTLLLRLARLQFRSGNPDEARQKIANWLAAGESTSTRILRATRMLEEFKMADEVETMIRNRITESDRDSEAEIELRHALADFFERQERKTEAVEIWKALASGGDLARALRFTDELRRRGESGAAFEILSERTGVETGSLTFLENLIGAAIESEQYEAAWTHSLQRVHLATTPTELGEAIDQAIRISRLLDRPELIEQLRAKRVASPNQQGLIARLLALDGKPNEALEIVRKFRPENPAFSWAQEAAILKENQHWSAAAEAIEGFLKLPGEERNIAQFQELASLWERAGELEKALVWIRRWGENAPGNWRVRLREAALLEKSGQKAEALQVLRRASRTFDTETEVLTAFARACEKGRLLAEAEDVYWRLYAAAETGEEKLRWVPRLYELVRSSGQVDRLIDQFQQRREANRTSAVPLLALAEIYRQQNDEDKRRAVLAAASRLEPRNISLILALVTIEEEAGAFDAALRQLERAEELDESGVVTERIVRLSLRTGSTAAAVTRLKKLIESGEMGRDESLGAIEALVILGEFGPAATLTETLRAGFPDDPELSYLLGVIRKANREWVEAAGAFIRVMDLTEPDRALMEAERDGLLSDDARLVRVEQSKNRVSRHQRIRGKIYALPHLALVMGLGNRPGSSKGYRRPAPLIEPSVAGDYFFYALGNLDALASRMTKPERKAVAIRAERAGLPAFRARWFEAAVSSKEAQFFSSMDPLNDDPVALELATVIDPDIIRELSERSLEVFEVDRPEIAIFAAMRLATFRDLTMEERRRHVQKALELGDRIESPKSKHLERWNYFAGYLLKADEFPEFSPAERRSIALLGVELYRHYRKAGEPAEQWVFEQIAAPLATEDLKESFEQLLKLEIDRAATDVKAKNSSPAILERGLANHLNFGSHIPEEAVSSFPVSLLCAVIAKPAGGNLFSGEPFSGPPFSGGPSLGGLMGGSPAGLPAVFTASARLDPDDYNDPVIRFLLSVCREDRQDVIDKRLATMLAATGAGDDRFLVAVHYLLNVNRDEKRAAALLKGMLDAPPGRPGTRWASQIIAVFLGRSTNNVALQKSALQALAEETMDSGAQMVFQSLFQEAGIQPKPAIAVAGSGRAVDPFATPPSFPGAGPLSISGISSWLLSGKQGARRIPKLVEQRRFDAAARLIRVELRPLALIQLSALGESDLGNPFTELISTTGELRDAIFKDIDRQANEAGINDRERAIAGATRELLGDYEGAAELYDTILKVSPEDDIVRLRKIAVTAVPGTDPDGWLDELRKLNAGTPYSIRGIIFNDRHLKSHPVAEAAGPLIALLEKAAEVEWIREELVPELESDIQLARDKLNRAFYRPDAGKSPDLAHQEASERFHRALMIFPDQAPEALSYLTALFEIEGRPIPENFWEICREILTDRTSRIPGLGEVKFRLPQKKFQVRTFPELAAYLAATHGVEKELRRVIREWESAHRGPAPEYALFADLHLAPPEKFAERLVEHFQSKADQRPRFDYWPDLLQNALLIAHERELDVNLNGALNRIYRSQGPWPLDLLAIVNRVRWLGEHDRVAEADELIRTIFTSTLQNAEEMRVRAMVESQLESVALTRRKLAFRLLSHVAEIGTFGLTAWDLWEATPDRPEGVRPPSLGFLKSPDWFKETERTVMFMKQIGLLAPAESFRLRMIPEDFHAELKAHHWVSLIVRELRKIPDSIPAIEKRVNADFPDSPGAALVFSLAKHGIDGQNCVDLMAAHLDLFDKLRESEKPDAACYINERSDTYRSCPELGDWVWEHWSDQLEAEIDALFERPPESGDYGEFDRYLAEAIKHRQHDFGLGILNRWVERERDFVEPGRRTSIVAERLSVLSVRYKYMSADQTWSWGLDEVEAVEFQLAAFGDPRIAPFEFEFPYFRWLNRTNPKTHERLSLSPKDKMQHLQRLGTHFEAHPMRDLLFPPAMSALLSNVSDRETKKQLLNAANKAEDDGAWLLREAGSLGEELGTARLTPEEGLPLELSKILEEASTPLPVRLNLANWNFDRTPFPPLLDAHGLATVFSIWNQALGRPDSQAIPPEMADVANRMAVALRSLHGDKLKDLAAIDPSAMAAGLKQPLRSQVEKEMRKFDELPSTVRAYDLVSAFWPAYINLLLIDGEFTECLDLWEWMTRKKLPIRWARRYDRDEIGSEQNFLNTVAYVAFQKGGPEGAAVVYGRIAHVLRESGREESGSVLDRIVHHLMFGLPAADRVWLVAGWLADPPEGFDPGRKWEAVRPYSRPSSNHPGASRPDGRTKLEYLQEFLEELAAKPIDESTAPLVLARVFREIATESPKHREFLKVWLSERKATEIEASPILREMAWAIHQGNPPLETRHLAALKNPQLPSRYGFEMSYFLWIELGYRDPRTRSGIGGGESFQELVKTTCRQLVAELKRGARYFELRNNITPPIVQVLSDLAKHDPEAAELGEQILANASNALEGMPKGGTVAKLWSGALLGFISPESGREEALPSIRVAAKNPALVPEALSHYLQLGFTREAGRLFEKNWQQIDPARSIRLRFDPSHRTMLEAIGNEEVRFLGEIFVGVGFDPVLGDSSTERRGESRERRIEALTEKFRARTFGSEAIRTKAFDALVTFPGALVMLKEDIREGLDGDIESLIAIPADAEFSKQWRLWCLHLDLLIREGKLDEFAALIPDRRWFETWPAPDRSGRSRSTRQEKVWLGLFKAVEENLALVSREKLDQLETVLGKLEVIPGIESAFYGRSGAFASDRPVHRTGELRFINPDTLLDFAALRLALDVTRGIEAPGAWMESLPDIASKASPGNGYARSMALNYLKCARILSPAGKGTLDERRQAIAEYINVSLPIQLFGFEQRRFFLYHFLGWFDRDEILSFGPEEAEAEPRGGHAFGDLAVEISSRDPELAYRLMKRAMEMLDPTDRTPLYLTYEFNWKKLKNWKQTSGDSTEGAPESGK